MEYFSSIWFCWKQMTTFRSMVLTVSSPYWKRCKVNQREVKGIPDLKGKAINAFIESSLQFPWITCAKCTWGPEVPGGPVDRQLLLIEGGSWVALLQKMAGDPRPIPLSLWVLAFFVLQVGKPTVKFHEWNCLFMDYTISIPQNTHLLIIQFAFSCLPPPRPRPPNNAETSSAPGGDQKSF